MSKSHFNAPHFKDPEAARTYLEGLRWGKERVCPHCGTVNESFATKKAGVYRCRSKECRKDFSVTTKSVMESSHIKLNVWLQAFFLMASSKKGMSSHQLHRALGITYKSAWFLTHRIREAMRVGGLVPPMGSNGGTVEADETFIGRLQGQPKKGRRAWSNKNVVLTLVERGGSARSFHVDGARIGDLQPIIRANLSREANLMSDEMYSYKRPPMTEPREPPAIDPDCIPETLCIGKFNLAPGPGPLVTLTFTNVRNKAGPLFDQTCWLVPSRKPQEIPLPPAVAGAISFTDRIIWRPSSFSPSSPSACPLAACEACSMRP